LLRQVVRSDRNGCSEDSGIAGQKQRNTHSKNVISGIVQNWYLSVGRKQEKSIGCLSVIIVAIGTISLAIFLICFLIII